MNRPATRLAASVTLLLFWAVGGFGPETSYAQEADPVRSPVRSDDALIYFYRTKSLTDSFLNPTIYSKGRELARLEKDQYFALPVAAGTHYFSWTDDPDDDEEAWVTVTRGQLAFFRVRYRAIEPVEDFEAIEQMRDLGPIEAGNIFDPSVVSIPVIDTP